MARIAIVQPKPVKQEEQLRKYVKRAHNDSVDIILFPEGFLPSFTSDETLELADKTVELIAKLSLEYNLSVAVGIKEKFDGKRYLSLILVCDGKIISIHRKVILTEYELRSFARGMLDSAFPVVDVKRVGRVGLAICYENLFPEVLRLLRYKGAEIVLAPHGSGMRAKTESFRYDYHEKWLCHLRSRAMENQFYIVTATNVFREDLMGVVIDPLGNVLIDEREGGYQQIAVDVSFARNFKRKGKKLNGLGADALLIDLAKLPPDIYKMLYDFSTQQNLWLPCTIRPSNSYTLQDNS